MKSNSSECIIFFDGVCGLCNGFVDFIIRIDSNQIFKFSPLQSEYAQKNLPSEFIQSLDSVVVMIDGKTLKKGEAVMAVFERLGSVWKILSLGGLLPKGIMDRGYDLVASNRYKLFGKKETCRIPSPEERARFIL